MGDDMSSDGPPVMLGDQERVLGNMVALFAIILNGTPFVAMIAGLLRNPKLYNQAWPHSVLASFLLQVSSRLGWLPRFCVFVLTALRCPAFLVGLFRMNAVDVAFIRCYNG